ncbi:hypothetical protein FS842_000718 [Serendipita sp. 407]|nr:hypothetical protein FS842_000718 [Serendipita sp. 407]
MQAASIGRQLIATGPNQPFSQITNLSFKNNQLSVPGYKFNEAKQWNDTGSSTLLATGFALKTGSQVLAKIAPAHSNSAICLGREVVINNQLSSMPDGTRVALSMAEAFSIPKSAGDCEVVIYLSPGINALGRYFPPGSINDLLLPWVVSMDRSKVPPDLTYGKLQRDRLKRSITDSKTIEYDEATETAEFIEPTETTTEKGNILEESTDVPMDVDDMTLDFSAPQTTAADAAGVELLNTDDYSRDAWDVMDLASFLEFAINSTHCLEILHKSGHKHREVRANAFHVSMHSGAVRFAHFGNRSESLEKTGGPSQLVLRASGLIPPDDDTTGVSRSDGSEKGRDDDDLASEFGELRDTRKVKEAICYLAPEQTGTGETNIEDHRTDLYALGVLFWTMAVGNGTLPFDGSPVEILHKVVQSKPSEVHEVRRDIPIVLSAIISKLLSKSPDARYNSAIGLKNDLMECQKRLTLSCASMETPGNALMSDVELIPPFELGEHDMFLELTIPGDLFGREKEMQEIRTVIRSLEAAPSGQVHSLDSGSILSRTRKLLYGQSTVSFAALSNGSNVSVGYSNASFGGAGTSSGDTRMIEATVQTGKDDLTGMSGIEDSIGEVGSPARVSSSDSALVKGIPPAYSTYTHPRANASSSTMPPPGSTFAPLGHSFEHHSQSHHSHSLSHTSISLSHSTVSGGSIRNHRTAQAHSIVISGPAGIGKSTLVQMNQAYWRRQGLWGHAKMVKDQASPFTAVLTSLSSVLRQLMMFQSERQVFVSLLKARLGQQIYELPLLYHGVPELRDLLGAFGVHLAEPQVLLSTEELGARFQTLVDIVYSSLADVKPLALVLDDIHFADKSTMELISLLADSKSRMLIMTTCRDDDVATVKKVRRIFSNKNRTTWIDLAPLDSEALGNLVSTTLQRSKEDIAPLARLVARVSCGNPFLARNLLQTVWRQRHIWYEWGINTWQYNLEAIEQTVHAQQLISAPTDISFLVAHFRELNEDAQQYLIWASIFGPTFKANDVANMMDNERLEESSDDGSVPDVALDTYRDHEADRDQHTPMNGFTRPSLRGLQQVVAQGWIIQRARDMCSFTHDKYRQAATHMASQRPDVTVMRMCLKAATYLMQEPERDVFRITEYCRRCIPLVREDPNREEFIGCLVQAAESSATRGAHELALHAFKDARSLLGDGSWHDSPERTKDLTLKLAELYGSQGNHESSDQLIFETLAHVQGPADRAHALRLRGRNRFVRKDFESAFNDIVQALDALNIKLPTKISPLELDDSFNEVKAKILLTGFDELLELPRSMNPLTDLAVSLMADCATSAFWGCPNIFGMPEYIGIQIINIALTDGVSPGTAQGLFWCLGGASERRHMYRFCSDLAKLGLQMAYKFGSTSDKCRCETLFSAFASGYSPEPIRTIIPRVEAAISEASSAGDRVYEAFARCHALSLRLYCSEHLSDLVPYAEEIVTDIRAWAVNSDTNSLAMGILMTIRALAGETDGRTVDNAFDTEKWKEAHFLHKLHDSSGNFNVVMNWYNSFKISGLYGLGFYTRAAELGFDVYATRSSHPSHRHIRYGLFFHSLAMIQCIRHGDISATQREQYLQQIDINQQYIKAWVSPSPANNSAWHALVQAEMASLEGNPEAFKFYDNAIKIAVNDDWIMEEAWALYLEGSHFLRCGVEGLGSELQARGIARHRQWGAFGIVNHLNQPVGVVPIPFKRQIFSVEAGVQTDATEIAETLQLDIAEEVPNTGSKPSQDDTSILTATDLAAVLRWSQIISSDINLSSSLQRLTEIAIENSGAQEAAFVMKTDEGDYTVVTSCVPPQPCIVFEQPKSIRRIGDPLKRAVLQHCLNSRSRVYFAESTNEPRFAQEAALSVTRSVICVPFSNNRGQTYGALYLGSHYAFSQTNLALLSLLSQQASISIANALLFQSVQQATKANLQMIQFQRQALEEARASKEDAMKATKIKSNFLASMSHELRTPFSSFYGLLDILGGTKLDSNQKELVQTAKQSCELLLKIIDSILDYSKLEASALKLEAVPFLVEDVVADCVELLLPLANNLQIWEYTC